MGQGQVLVAMMRTGVILFSESLNILYVFFAKRRGNKAISMLQDK